MDLTDEQWALIQPLIPPPSPHSRGRPTADPRATLNGIFRKLRLGAPWYNLPPYALECYPSWQTCYRAYRRWGSTGLMNQIFKLLYQHLHDQTGLDLIQSLQSEAPTNPAGSEGSADLADVDHPIEDTHPDSEKLNQNSAQTWITLVLEDSRWQLRLSPDLENTWQGSTALLLARVLLAGIRYRLDPVSTRTLTKNASGKH